ncbi:MAG: CBS domain-containing protein [Proteobacteria bacterium]|nr:CBS domain-containing protein [Pseudomonadota bacterium]
MIVERIIRGKSGAVATVSAQLSLAEVCALLTQRRIGAVPVMDGATLVGIISERDIVHVLAEHGAAALDLKVADAMTREVKTTTMQTTVEEAMAAMTAGRFRHLPVVEGGKLIGIVSIGDVVKARLDEQQYEVENLRSYVVGAS